ncbi:MAG TPA: LLM class flavin-dependent oxidoreductase [Acidimicrobiales bacterium]|nr:LLM class flavin-dependent oxidoreductase [Acidimicrobiales bacterium]
MGIRWGVWFEPVQPVRRLCELASLAENLGAEVCLVADEGTERDLHVAMTAILMSTEAMIVGPGITNPFSRHPVTSAAAVATLEELAPGRVWQGYGVGGSRVLGPLGIDPPRPYTALKQAVEINQTLLAGQAAGPARLGWEVSPVPLAMAGRGPRVQHLAATTADWVLLSAKAVPELPAAAERIRGARPQHPARIAWSSYMAYDPEQRRRVLPHFTYMAVDAPPDIREAAGLDDTTAAAVRSLMLEGRMEEAAELLPDSMVDVYAVAGTPEECSRIISANRDHFDLFLLPMNDLADCENHIRTVALILERASRL